jgi:hypothetical protein
MWQELCVFVEIQGGEKTILARFTSFEHGEFSNLQRRDVGDFDAMRCFTATR